MRWVEIFKAGDHVARNGMQREYSAAELEQVANSYDPAVYRAPLIVEHRTNGVADGEIHKMPWCFGVPSALQVVGNTVKAGFAKIAPEFLEWVENGNLIDVSAGLYPPDDFRNPAPGQWSLRHIAALGSQSPSIKGLKGLEELLYAEDEQPIEIAMPAAADAFVEFQEQFVEQHAGALTQKVEAMSQQIDKLLALNTPVEIEAVTGILQSPEFGEAFERLARWGLKMAYMQSGKTLMEVAMAADITPERLKIILDSGSATYEEAGKISDALGLADAEFSEPTPRELAMRQREADLAKREADLRKQQVIEFMEPLVTRGQVLPGDRVALETVLLHLETSQPIEFAEGDGVASKAPAEVLRDWMTRLKKQIEFAELAPGEDQDDLSADYAEPPTGYGIDRERQKQLAAAKRHVAKNGGTLDEALRLVGVK